MDVHPSLSNPATPRPPAATDRAKPTAFRRLRVLAVDDEPAVRRLVAEFCRRDSHRVVTAADGHEALGKFRSGRFDLVIADRSMPRMTGDQLAASIKELNPETPVILLSGIGSPCTAHSVPRGADRVLGKPFTLQQLRQTIAEVRNGRSPREGG